jgi:hypothetical protein
MTETTHSSNVLVPQSFTNPNMNQPMTQQDIDKLDTSLANEQSQDAPTDTNSSGGRQSRMVRDYTLVPPDALASVARVLHNGMSKYGKDNWRLIPCDDHLNHVLNHVYLYLAGNTQEDHLSNAATRMLMALEQQLLDNTPKSVVD